MEYNEVIIKIKDGDPLCVEKERLTKDSTVFKRIIDELKFYEFELEDFKPDIVGLFVTLLDDRKLEDIQNSQFRDLHKMSVVFKVDWLTEACRSWLSNKMNSDMTDDEKFFVFEECLFILRKWHTDLMMDALVAKIAVNDNSSFISRYLKDFDNLDAVQLKLMLIISGGNSKLFLQSILKNLTSKNELGENVKFLLQSMNLTLCCESNNALYTAVVRTVSSLPNISVADMRFVLELTAETTRLVNLKYRNISARHVIRSDVVRDGSKFTALHENIKLLKDITDAVGSDQITSMFVVLDQLLRIVYIMPPHTNQEIAELNLLVKKA